MNCFLGRRIRKLELLLRLQTCIKEELHALLLQLVDYYPIDLSASVKFDQKLFAKFAGPQPRITFVSGLWNIRKEEAPSSNNNNKSCAEYFKLAEQLFDWNADFVFFTEPLFVTQVIHEREKRGLLHRTIVIPLTIKQSSYYRYFHLLENHFKSKNIPARWSPTKDTPLYAWSQATKWDCMERALGLNAFNNTSLFWIDFGIYHIAESPNSIFLLQRQLSAIQRIRCTLLRPLNQRELKDEKTHWYRSLQQAVAGGLVGGPFEQVKWLCSAFRKEFEYALQIAPALDESILGALFLQNLNRFAPKLTIRDGHKEILQVQTSKEELQRHIDFARFGVKDDSLVEQYQNEFFR